MGTPRLNTPLVLEEAERASDGLGGHILIWRPVARVWAEMRNNRGREHAGEVGARSTTGWRVTVRAARPGDPRRPRPDQRFRMAERLFLISAVAEADISGRFLICTAIEEDQV